MPIGYNITMRRPGNFEITPPKVATIRHGGATSNLIFIARVGMLIASVLLILAILYLFRRRYRS